MRLGFVGCWGCLLLPSVLVSRISILHGIERAAFYGIALAFATFLVGNYLVTFEYGSSLDRVATVYRGCIDRDRNVVGKQVDMGLYVD